MSENLCPQCGAPIAAGATECKYCGEKLPVQQAPNPNAAYQNSQPPVYPQQTYQQPAYQQPVYAAPPMYADGIDPSWPIKSKVAAGLLAIFLGGLGIHKFYLGKIGVGVVYLLFSWTCIPSFIGLIEGIIYLTSNDHNFQVKNRVRLQ